MTHLRVYAADEAGLTLVDTTDPVAIAAVLSAIDVRFEQWPTRGLPSDPSEEVVLAAYAPEIARLQGEGGYRKVDTIRLKPDHPERETMRGKFLSEHRHAEDEVRFFVEGAGLFTLHGDDERIYAVLCEQGDLISVPAGTRHWFDMGPAPQFVVIRLFTNPEGWVAQFTGDAIADRFPRHEPPQSLGAAAA